MDSVSVKLIRPCSVKKLVVAALCYGARRMQTKVCIQKGLSWVRKDSISKTLLGVGVCEASACPSENEGRMRFSLIQALLNANYGTVVEWDTLVT
jgi:hypothetical protein